MDYLPIIKRPIEAEMEQFVSMFNESLSHSDGLLCEVLDYVKQRGGKRMRPMLILLLAKALGEVNPVTYHAAMGLELLHTASLVHDDVVDEAALRRGQASVNAQFQNKVAVLVGDYILSVALVNVNKTRNLAIVDNLSLLGRTLSEGELLQLQNISSEGISEDVYYSIIKRKTAALFESCGKLAALSVNADEGQILRAGEFGMKLGMMFQVRDDIFDYFEDSAIGKPTGNDMLEGKLTLPAIHAILSTGNEAMMEIAKKVKYHTVSPDEIADLVTFTKQNGGIEYAKQVMRKLQGEAEAFIEADVSDPAIKEALNAYLAYVIERNK